MRIFFIDIACGLLICAAVTAYVLLCVADLITGGRFSRRDQRRAY